MTKLFSGTPRLAFLLSLVAVTGMTPTQSPTASQDNELYKIRVNANLVVLHATAQDRKGILVSGLDQNNFQVYEDGARQQIKHFSHQDLPVTVGLVIDNSGSMASKRALVIAAALQFAHSSNPQDQIFVVNFNEHVRFGLPENVAFTDQVPELEVALSKIHTNGQTALYDAVAAALEHLKLGNRDKKVLIVISDGGDNASKQSNLAQVMAMARHTETIIYTIGLFEEEDEDRNPRVLKQLAEDTGGDVFLPSSLKEAVPICERIAHDIRNQYTLAYAPTNTKQDGTLRTIQVKASDPAHGQLLVRTRTGYVAPVAKPQSPSAKRNVP
ncbi:MAG TPA: VWA domain-containing protein [Candidatus Angelobacter sp.]|nr:VWA domain-containing protein [Candidatus Angelobacter sp.]